MNKKEYCDLLRQQITDVKIKNANLYSEILKSDNNILNDILKEFEDIPQYLYPHYYTALYLTTIKDTFDDLMFEKYNIKRPVRNADHNFLITSIEKDYDYIMDYYSKLNYCYEQELLFINEKKLTK